MLIRKLGRTGLKVAALCLGGKTFGWTTDQKASEAVLDAYVEAGGNFIDTADVYSRWAPGNTGGESETALGVWFAARKHRPSVLIATKVCGPMGPGPNDKGLDRKSTRLNSSHANISYAVFCLEKKKLGLLARTALLLLAQVTER